MIPALQNRWHAVRIASSVMDMSHEVIRRHGDMNAAFNSGTVGLHRTVPEPCKREHGLIDYRDVERRLAAFVVHVPLKKAGL
jgi:hypothetical protein